jgi:hypothetical protein
MCQVWERPINLYSSAAILARKIKLLRGALKHSKMSLSKLKLVIDKCNLVILFFDNLEKERAMFIHEYNFKKNVQHHRGCLNPSIIIGRKSVLSDG